MKTINVTFEDEDIKELERLKGSMTWRQFIIQFIGKKDAGLEDEDEKVV